MSDEFEDMELGVGEDPRVGGVDSGPALCSGDAFWRLGDPGTVGETQIPENEIGVRLLRPPLSLFLLFCPMNMCVPRTRSVSPFVVLCVFMEAMFGLHYFLC